MSENQLENRKANLENITDIEKEMERLQALRASKLQEEVAKNKSEENQVHNVSVQQDIGEVDEVTKVINDTGKFARLPKSDGEKAVFQFFNDKKKRRVVEKSFKDPKTNQERPPQKRIEYDVIVPEIAEQGEKKLDVPKTLAAQIEANIDKNHCLLEITRHGTAPKVTYTVVAC